MTLRGMYSTNISPRYLLSVKLNIVTSCLRGLIKSGFVLSLADIKVCAGIKARFSPYLDSSPIGFGIADE